LQAKNSAVIADFGRKDVESGLKSLLQRCGKRFEKFAVLESLDKKKSILFGFSLFRVSFLGNVEIIKKNGALL
jgi:hypothetical protein